MGQAFETPLPYVTQIRRLLQEEQISEARNVLSLALRQPSPPEELLQLQRLLAPPIVTTSELRDRDRSQEIAWLVANGQNYRGEWVALAGEELLAHAPSLTSLLDEMDDSPQRDQSIIHWIERG